MRNNQPGLFKDDEQSDSPTPEYRPDPDSVRARKRGGRGAAAWLTAEQQAAVLEQAATGAFHTAADVRRWIQEQFGLSYRPKGIYRLLKRLGCRPKVPRPVHEKANLAGQVAWKKGGSPRRSGRLVLAHRGPRPAPRRPAEGGVISSIRYRCT